MMRTLILVLILGGMFGAAALDEKLPNTEIIQQALAHAQKVREQTGFVPEAALKIGALIDVGDARCGFVLVKVESAKGAGGATYKLTERIKVAAPRGTDFDVADYTGTLMLDKDLSLLSASQRTERTLTSGQSSESEVVTAEVQSGADQLSWVRTERRGSDKPIVTKPEPIKLHGVKPIPRNALPSLAGLASKETGFKPGVFSPLCVAAMDLSWSVDEFTLQPAWLSFDVPPKDSPEGAAFLLKLRYLEGEIGDKGLTVNEPALEVWTDSMDWLFDSQMHVIRQPASGDLMLSAKNVDPDEIDVNMVFNEATIREAIKNAEAKLKKPVTEKITKVPLK